MHSSAADAASCLQELNASSMVNVVWALAKTDYAGNGNRRTRTLLDNIAKSAMSQMDCFTPEQLSRLLWAFSTLHHWHEELYDAVAAETLRQVGVHHLLCIGCNSLPSICNAVWPCMQGTGRQADCFVTASC